MDEIVFDAVRFILEIPAQATGIIESISFDNNSYIVLPEPIAVSQEIVMVY